MRQLDNRGEFMGPMRFLTHDPIDLDKRRWTQGDLRDGASVEFLGIVRAQEGDLLIEALEYEAYGPMAEALIGGLMEEAKRLWPLHRVQIRHRVGRVPVGEAAVFVGVQAPHRDQAFAACRFLIDRVKREVPIWKRAVVHVEPIGESRVGRG